MNEMERPKSKGAPVIGALLMVDFVGRVVWLETNHGPLRLTSHKPLRLDGVRQGDMVSALVCQDGTLSLRQGDYSQTWR